MFKGLGEKLILLGFLDEDVDFIPYLHLWKIGSEIKKMINVGIISKKSWKVALFLRMKY